MIRATLVIDYAQSGQHLVHQQTKKKRPNISVPQFIIRSQRYDVEQSISCRAGG